MRFTRGGRVPLGASQVDEWWGGPQGRDSSRAFAWRDGEVAGVAPKARSPAFAGLLCGRDE